MFSDTTRDASGVARAAWGHDVITDFTSGEDRIDLSALGLVYAPTSAAFLVEDPSGLTLYLEEGGHIRLEGLASLDDGDFILS